MYRRAFMLSAVATCCLSPVGGLRAQGAYDDVEIVGPLPPLPADLSNYADSPPAVYADVEPVGTAKPSGQEIEEAYRILLNSPYDCDLLTVAEYFANLSGDDATYRREWPVRANPVIYHFFTATLTKPQGDTTAWCAAALNWWILRSKAKSVDEIGVSPGSFSMPGEPFPSANLNAYSTKSAASGSFRCWPKTNAVKKGDILVLANKGTDSMSKLCLGQGHVAIYISKMEGDRVQVIGGNQSHVGSNGAITYANFSIGPGSRYYAFVKNLGG